MSDQQIMDVDSSSQETAMVAREIHPPPSSGDPTTAPKRARVEKDRSTCSGNEIESAATGSGEQEIQQVKDKGGSKGEPKESFQLFPLQHTVSRGFLDVSLLLSNANVLQMFWLKEKDNAFFMPIIIFLIISISLQSIVGLILIISSVFKPTGTRMKYIHAVTMVCIAIITAVNVFIVAFNASGERKKCLPKALSTV